MRVNIGIVARADNGSTPDERAVALLEAVEHAKRIIRFSFPARPMEVRIRERIDLESGVAHIAWTNESDSGELQPFVPRGTGTFSYLGYINSESSLETIANTPDLLQISTSIGGCFTLLRSNRGAFESITDATRSFGMYHGKSPRLRIVGSRALLVHLLLRADQVGVESAVPQYDPLPLRHMVMQGHYMADQTPFTGVTAQASSSLIRIDPWQTRFESAPATIGSNEVFNLERSAERVAEALSDAFAPLAGSSLTLQLTGGRDSRILAAALACRGDITFSTATSGTPEHPDVSIAQTIASLLGVEHRIVPPRGYNSDSDTIEAETPEARIVRALDVHDAMTSGWDDVVPYGAYNDKRIVSGVGGEVLRGGLILPDLEWLSAQDAITRLRNTMINAPFLLPSYTEAAAALAAPLIDLAQSDPNRAIDDYYFTHRNNRWVVARRAGARHKSNPFDPLLDNRLIRRLRETPAHQRWNEELFFLATTLLAPRLRDVPLEGRRWRFERSAPTRRFGQDVHDTWDQRHAISTPPTAHQASWQRLLHPVARKHVYELILDSVPSLDWLFDRKKLEDYLVPEPPRYPTVVWHIATVITMLTTEWYKTPRPIDTPRFLLVNS